MISCVLLRFAGTLHPLCLRNRCVCAHHQQQLSDIIWSAACVALIGRPPSYLYHGWRERTLPKRAVSEEVPVRPSDARKRLAIQEPQKRRHTNLRSCACQGLAEGSGSERACSAWSTKAPLLRGHILRESSPRNENRHSIAMETGSFYPAELLRRATPGTEGVWSVLKNVSEV